MATCPSREEAWLLLTEHTEGENLRRHALAVEAAMRAYALKQSADPETWGIAGLVHDFDYEKHPSPEEHPAFGVSLLRERGWPEEIVRAVLAHAPHTGVPAGHSARKDPVRGGRALRLPDRLRPCAARKKSRWKCGRPRCARSSRTRHSPAASTASTSSRGPRSWAWTWTSTSSSCSNRSWPWRRVWGWIEGPRRPRGGESKPRASTHLRFEESRPEAPSRRSMARPLGICTGARRQEAGWWGVLDLNQRLLPCEDSTLPLS